MESLNRSSSPTRRAACREKKPQLKTSLPKTADSLARSDGGEARLGSSRSCFATLFGRGHCAQAIARLAVDCGLFVSVLDDRAELLKEMPPQVTGISAVSAPEFIASRRWQADEAIVIVSRHHELDREALAAALQTIGAGYIGMIGSRRKVRQVLRGGGGWGGGGGGGGGRRGAGFWGPSGGGGGGRSGGGGGKVGGGKKKRGKKIGEGGGEIRWIGGAGVELSADQAVPKR